jgi:hypothetical protein
VSERRKHPRVPKDLHVTWRLIEGDGHEQVQTGPALQGFTRDLSSGGLCIEVPKELKEGTPLALDIARDSGGPPLSALGRIAWCRRDGDTWLAGIEFTWIECTLPESAFGLAPATVWTLL